MGWGDYSDWFRRRRRRPFFSWFFKEIDEVFRDFERMFERHMKWPLKGEVKGPFIYGFSVTAGPDGRPRIREFGNVKPTLFGPRIREEREPLVDVYETKDEVKVVAELPGVEKEDIQLHGTEDSLTILVDTAERKYYREVKLPAKVDPKAAKTTYKNGVLEVTLPKKNKNRGEPIKIE